MSHWWCCCPDIEVPPGPCTCEYSSDGNAPCCFKVTILNMADGDNCLLCNSLNKSYYLTQTEAGACTWSCRHLCPTLVGAPCADKGLGWEITLTVSDEGDGQYKITVDLGPHKWSKTYNGKPSLSDITDTLDWVSDSGSCASSGASCTISTSLYDIEGCPCACEVVCPQCEDQLSTSLVEVTISGVANAGSCAGCSIFNGTFTLNYAGCGARTICCDTTTYASGSGPFWIYTNNTGWPCPAGTCKYFGIGVTFRLLRNSSTGTWYAGVSLTPAGTTECTSSGDCSDNKVNAWFTKTLDLEGEDTDCRTFTFSGFSGCSTDDSCDVSGAEVTVTAL